MMFNKIFNIKKGNDMSEDTNRNITTEGEFGTRLLTILQSGKFDDKYIIKIFISFTMHLYLDDFSRFNPGCSEYCTMGKIFKVRSKSSIPNDEIHIEDKTIY